MTRVTGILMEIMVPIGLMDPSTVWTPLTGVVWIDFDDFGSSSMAL